MEDNNLKVLITTSGLGSRLGEITKYTNKSLIRLGDKGIISHIIDQYKNADFVITLGHHGDLVKQYLEISHPNINFQFVYVDPYEGEGSGLIKSMSFAENYLQCPFIFHACDTVAYFDVNNINENWMGCVTSNQPDIFRTVCVNNGEIHKINEKGEINYDFAYVGIAGIYDYKIFWKELNKLNNLNLCDSSDCHVFIEMLKTSKIHVKKIEKWYDTGSVLNLNNARNEFNQTYTVLDKPEETIYFFDEHVIKFFHDPTIVENRIKRSEKLKNLTPKIIKSTKNFYKYELFDGELLSKVLTEDKLKKLIEWGDEKLWKKTNEDIKIFQKTCHNFYYDKSILRIKKYLKDNSQIDKIDIINEITVPTYEEIFNSIDWNLIITTEPTHFHGDFILDNILFKNNEFILLDWRQDFGGNILSGDKYYDLSKLNHNLILNHDILNNNHFFIKTKNNKIYCDVYRSHNLVQYQETYLKILKERNINIHKINILTSLIWMNMSPLHEYPLNHFLYYFGKYNLWREISKKK